MNIDPDILSLDLACISHKACVDEGWSLPFVDTVERQYRAFLQLIRTLGRSGRIAPTRLIDRYWHHHILDTAKYARDCETLFQAFIHHYPYSGLLSADDAAQQRERVAHTVHALEQLICSETPATPTF